MLRSGLPSIADKMAGDSKHFPAGAAAGADDDAEDEDLVLGSEDGEIFIDLEKLLEFHRTVRIRIPPQASSNETSSEEGMREIVVSKGLENGGIVV